MAIAKQNLSLSLLGPFVLDGEASPSLPRRAQALPALLALQKGRPLTREMVADLLWTHSGPEQARHSLRQSLVVLRRTLGGTVIRAEAELLAVPAEAIAVDVVEFEALASSNGLGDLSRCAELYQGELLQNIGSVSARFDEWLEIERKRLIGLAATVFRRLSEARAAAGDFGGALAAGRRLVGLDDLNEEAHRWLIRLLTKSGRCAEALRQYETCAETLKRELGITPEASTIELMHSIRSGAAAETAPLARFTMADTALPDADRRQIAALRVSSLKLGGKTWVRIVGALAFACVVAAAVGAMTIKPRAVLPSLTLVVAPFVNNAGVDGQDLAIAGIADVIVAELRETHSLRVAQYREDDVVPVHDRVAADPAARFVVEGSASFSSSLDVNVRLIDRNGVALWSEHYDAPRGDVLNLASDIATHVSRAVARDSSMFRADQPAVAESKQTARELLALAAYVRFRVSALSVATFRRIVGRVVEHRPYDAEALALLGNGYLNEFSVTLLPGDLVEAERYFDRALEVDQANVVGLWGKCYLRRMESRFADALELCRRVIDINPHHAGALREIGYDLLGLHDASAAIAWFQAAIAAAPTHPFLDDAYLGIAEGELEQEQIETARSTLQDSLRYDHWGSRNGLWLACVLEIAGHHAEAKSALAEFYQHHPEFSTSDDIAARLFFVPSEHRRLLVDALHRLDPTETRADKG